MSTTPRLHLTTKQSQIVAVVYQKNTDGTLIDLDQLLDRLPYETTKQSIHFSLRPLIERGFLKKAGHEKRRNRSRLLLDLGEVGAALCRTTVAKLHAEGSVTTDETPDAAVALEEVSGS